MIVRGRVLRFLRPPAHVDDIESYEYIEDGGIRIAEGRVSSVGAFDDLPADPEVVDHRPHLLIPGFIDTHLHFPQVQVIGSYSAELLDWLNDYTFPAEQAFADEGHAARMASRFLDELLRYGTTTAVAYCSSSPVSVNAYFREAERRGLGMLGGKVMMDRNAPAALCDTAQSGYDDSRALLEAWHGQGRSRYVISPRFAITSTTEQLESAGALAAEHPECHIQTHMNETPAEIEFVRQLFPDAPDYLAVYERFGLVRGNTLLGHCIHMNEREIGHMAETGAVAVHCPTSNLFLGSGLFDKYGLEGAGVRTGLATDIGGGTSYSMLQTMEAAYKVQQLRRQRLDPLTSYYWATLGNAEALGMRDEIGSLKPGSFADIAVLDARATPAMALRMETVTRLAEELFVLQTMGDDRAVAQVYVAGRPCKPDQDTA